MRALLVISLVAFTVFAGCMFGFPEDRIEQKLQAYHMILHPLGLEWDDETQTLSGNITFSNIDPPQYTRVKDETGFTPRLTVRYYDDRPFAGGPGLLASWDLRIGHKLQNDETLVWNFSVTPESSIDEVGIIRVDVSYQYSAILKDLEGTDSESRILVSYDNPCILVNEQSVVQRQGIEECQPYRWRENEDSLYRMGIEGESMAPVEDWNNWDEIWEPLVPVRDYLNSFEYDNVTYYEGRVSGEFTCYPSCSPEGYGD